MTAAVFQRLLALVAALVVASAPLEADAAPRRGDEDRLETATKAWKSLSANRRRRVQRAPWLGVIAGLERAAPASGATRAVALVRAARAAEDLARISGSTADSRRAVELYLAAAEVPGSLADDALVEAARVEVERLQQVEPAREYLQRAIALKGDQRAAAAARLSALPPAPKAAHAAVAKPAPDGDPLEAATRQWQQLRTDPEKRRYRHHWLAAIDQLAKAGDCLAPEKPGALAFMRAARAAEDLSRLSKRRADAERAISFYLSVAEKCPQTSLVDDALVAAAGLESNRLGDLAAARRHLAQAASLGGDRAKDASRLARAIAADSEPEHVAAAPTPAAPPAQLPGADARPAAPAAAASDRAEDDGEELGLLLAAIDAAHPPEEKAREADVRRFRDALFADTELSLSEQVGLKVKRIVIDAGHGGHDTGAIGPGGTYEKDVTLAVAKKLQALLVERGYEAVLTRDTDVFLALEERTAFANRHKGDLFVSVHANAHRSRAQTGVETYSLNVASSRYAMRLAARENAASEGSISDLQFLLADLATRANTVDSARLARLVQSSIVDGVARDYGRPKDHGVKHALFYVLLGARMPAVLIETGFLSNPREEKRLASGGYQTALAEAIAAGIDRFVARRGQLASVK